MEKDNEISGGDGNDYTTLHREYDPRLGRWFTIDPEQDKFPEETPYSNNKNNPILNKDPDGDCPTCVLGGIIGAAVDYGTQVAVNYASGKENPFTENINLTTIATSAVAGFLTNGVSAIENGAAKLIISTSVAVVNNTVKVKTSDGGIHVDVETNPINIAKNAALDYVADKLVGKAVSGKSLQKTLSKTGFNQGQVAKAIKDTYKDIGKPITRATNQAIKSGSKKLVENTSKKLSAAPVKAATKVLKEDTKKKTNI